MRTMRRSFMLRVAPALLLAAVLSTACGERMSVSSDAAKPEAEAGDLSAGTVGHTSHGDSDGNDVGDRNDDSDGGDLGAGAEDATNPGHGTRRSGDDKVDDHASRDERSGEQTQADDVTARDGSANSADEVGDATDPDGFVGRLDVRIDGRDLTVTRPDGSVLHTESLPAADDAGSRSSFHAIALKPGATATELDAVVAISRGEVARLHHLRVRGDAITLDPVPDHLQPQGETEATIVLDWTPDGRSIVWTEPTADGPVLRTFGWDDGPGTGRQADDHARFSLDLPMDVLVNGFTIQGDAEWTLTLADGAGDRYAVAVERQDDGALALSD